MSKDFGPILNERLRNFEPFGLQAYVLPGQIETLGQLLAAEQGGTLEEHYKPLTSRRIRALLATMRALLNTVKPTGGPGGEGFSQPGRRDEHHRSDRTADEEFASEMGFSKRAIRRNSGFDSQQPPAAPVSDSRSDVQDPKNNGISVVIVHASHPRRQRRVRPFIEELLKHPAITSVYEAIWKSSYLKHAGTTFPDFARFLNVTESSFAIIGGNASQCIEVQLDLLLGDLADQKRQFDIHLAFGGPTYENDSDIANLTNEFRGAYLHMLRQAIGEPVEQLKTLIREEYAATNGIASFHLVMWRRYPPFLKYLDSIALSLRPSGGSQMDVLERKAA